MQVSRLSLTGKLNKKTGNRVRPHENKRLPESYNNNPKWINEKRFK